MGQEKVIVSRVDGDSAGSYWPGKLSCPGVRTLAWFGYAFHLEKQLSYVNQYYCFCFQVPPDSLV